MVTLTRVVGALTWVGLSFLVFLLWRIARFYEQSSGQRVQSQLFLPALVLLPAGAAYHVLLDAGFLGCVPADLLLSVGGVFLAIATAFLGQIMMVEQ